MFWLLAPQRNNHQVEPATVAAGAPNTAVQRQGRWKNGNMVARYTRGESAGEALKWLT